MKSSVEKTERAKSLIHSMTSEDRKLLIAYVIARILELARDTDNKLYMDLSAWIDIINPMKYDEKKLQF